MLGVLGKAAAQPGDAHVEFQDWAADATGTPLPNGVALTSGKPLTSAADANAIGQVYQGPVALLVDALTYSAADIFAGGFQDHAIGLTIGPDCATGGGGANVWNHADLVRVAGPLAGVPLETLPGDATINIALRRSARVGPHSGKPIEDCGVEVDIQYKPDTIQDLLDRYPGMIRLACLEMGRMQSSRVDVPTVAVQHDGSLDVTIGQTVNVDELHFLLDGHVALVQPTGANGAGKVHVPAVPGLGLPSVLRIEGRVRKKDATGAEITIPAAVRQIPLRRTAPAPAPGASIAAAAPQPPLA